MLELTVPKKQSNGIAKIYYVTSESKHESHIVVRIHDRYYCDCRDFMIRKLTQDSPYALWKHGQFVKDVDVAVPYGQEVIRAVRGTTKTIPAGSKW